MSDPERASTTTARSTHIAVIGAVSWPDIAARLSPALARVDAGLAKAQCLVLVPSSADVTDLAHELSAHLAPRGIGVVPLASPRLAKRVVASSRAQVLVSTPAGVTALLGASALALGELCGVGICAADDLERNAAELDQVLAESAKGATKVLTAARITPFVERILEGHLHGSRRVTASAEVAPTTIVQVEIVAVTSAAPLAPLADVLEAADAPSVGVLAADQRREEAARDVLTRLGQGADSALARVLAAGETGTSLLIIAGAPSGAAIGAACATHPARVVALVTAREREALATTLPGARFVPFALGAARAEALAIETQLRDRIRASLGEGLPAREMLALEPLLADSDPLAVAGALLRMYERERDGHRRTREARIEAEARPPREAAERAPRRPDSEGPPRKFDRDRPPRTSDRSGPPRKFDRDGPPRKFDRDAPPRKFDRDRPPRKFDRPGPPKKFARDARGDDGRGPRRTGDR